MSRLIIPIFLLIFSVSCSEEDSQSDAYGNFEATALTIGAEADGRILFFNLEEGQKLEAGQKIGLIDTVLADLQRQQIDARLGALPQKTQDALSEIRVLEKQKVNLVRERDRLQRLVAKKAAPRQQLDELNGQITVVDGQITSVRSRTQTANRAVLSEQAPLLAQRKLLDEQIRRAYIFNPVKGTVLLKLAQAGEMTGRGKPLYRIADSDTLKLRFYISGAQLQDVKIGQKINVLTDNGKDDFRQFSGTVSRISERAEFTPKSVQTKEERVKLVYAAEALVANPDGLLKIGMPAEVNFVSN